MTLFIREGETQRAFVERTLREAGEISAHEAMYGLVSEDGRRRGITRLAAIVEDLRRDMWDISTIAPRGAMAIYGLRSAPAPVGWGSPVGRARACPSCRMTHRVGTACAASSRPAADSGALSPLPPSGAAADRADTA